MKIRDLARSNLVRWWEVDQAKELGFITTEKRKPTTGRPSNWAILNECVTATDPFLKSQPDAKCQNVRKINPTSLPSRLQQGQLIRFREWSFALWYVVGDFGVGTGIYGFKRSACSAYLKAFPSCKSKHAARSSASRLFKRPQVKAAIAWEFAKIGRLLNIQHFRPETDTEVWDILHRLGSEQARWAPPSIQKRWIIAKIMADQMPPP